jgi:NAD-dependent SIR2 family protein deacetylase
VPLRILPASHLINIMTSMKEKPAFTLLIGAGASAASGVPLAQQLIDQWRKEYKGIYSEDENTRLETRHWYNRPEEYSTLFELLFDHPSQRRALIETYLSEARPSWGYVYLVDLLARHVFHTVFTTNFDDLLNEACYAFSAKVRPMVCSHDVSSAFVRVTQNRHAIIKLHGDFLYDNIKNTGRELESLEANMRNKFSQFANEFGMIVLGYSGRDRSIMDVLTHMLHDPTAFHNGLYWCTPSPDSLSPSVEQLARFPRVNIVRIQGFDAFMAELHEQFRFGPPPICTNPYELINHRVSDLLEALTGQKAGDHPSIQRALLYLAENIEQDALKKVHLPYGVLAFLANMRDDPDGAKRWIRKQLGSEPRLRDVIFAFDLVKQPSDADFAQQVLAAAREKHPQIWKGQAEQCILIAEQLMNARLYKESLDILDLGRDAALKSKGQGFDSIRFSINSAVARRLSGAPIGVKERKQLADGKRRHRNDPYISFTVATLFQQEDEATEAYESLTREKRAEIDGSPVKKLYDRVVAQRSSTRGRGTKGPTRRV